MINLPSSASSHPSSLFDVLLIEPDLKEQDLYLGWIRELTSEKCEVYSEFPHDFNWSDPFRYPLIILTDDSPELKQLETIKRFNPLVCVVVLSQHSNVERAVAAIRLGAEDYLVKPVTQGKLNQSLQRVIQRSKISPGAATLGGSENFLKLLNNCQSLSNSIHHSEDPSKPFELGLFRQRLQSLEVQLEATGKMVEQMIGVQRLVYMDEVTGLYNIRYLNYVLDRELGLAKVSGKSFAVLFIDADQFKAVNDQYGHLIGTSLLNELGNYLKKFVREKDIVFRYGGDEFVAVLSPCDLLTAKSVAERIRESVEKRSFLRNEGLEIQCTISIGVALFPDHAQTKREIVGAADEAMYHAKRAMRNRVVVSQQDRERRPAELIEKKGNYGRC